MSKPRFDNPLDAFGVTHAVVKELQRRNDARFGALEK